jgi:hypothetical protein
MYKLPPKPQGNYNQPPSSGRPSSNHYNNVNRSYDDVRRSQSREKLPPQANTPAINRSKDNLNINNNLLNRQQPSTNSRENLHKNTPQSRTPQQRPSSAQRVQVNPSWWG